MTANRLTRRGALLGLLAALPFWMAADEGPDLSGTWRWQWKDAQGQIHRHVLEVDGKGKDLVARERFDDQEPVKVTDLKVEGKKVHFSVRRGERRSIYDGTLANADTINGTVQVSGPNNQPIEYGWTALRDRPKTRGGER
ncbi:MAG: hypothetical protein IRY99_10130 [Isosphaeraceae bacterium]|nr:hypothetical protein [Isosphaeraceae bacterium]